MTHKFDKMEIIVRGDIMELTVFVAFGAGILSFVSPCVLPIYPAFVSYITGMS